MEQAILNYHYVSIDDSILAPYYKKICNYIINIVPLNISPNVITLFGLFGIFMSTLITIFFKNYFGIFFTSLICSLLLFFYQIMDTLDGMQGKRVNMYYNPTTELFDHGCDSITTCCVLYNLLSLSNSLNNHFIISLLFATCILFNFYLPTWQHSNTKTMHFRSGIFNPTESIFVIKLVYIFIGLFPSIFENTIIMSLILLAMIFTTIYHIFISICDTFKNTKKDYFNTTSSLLPLILSIISVLYLIYNSIDDTFYLNIIFPILISILNLIWYEISGLNFDISSVLLSFILNYCNSYFGIVMSLFLYIFLFNKYLRIMCDILNMKYFYSIP